MGFKRALRKDIKAARDKGINSTKLMACITLLIFLFLIMVLYIIPTSVFAANAGDDGTTNWDFIVPVTHQKTVPEGYIGIYTEADLNNVRNNLSGKYILMNDIGLYKFSDWKPIGTNESSPFTGTFDGNGYVIANMMVSIYEETEVFAGLFGYISSANIKNVGMVLTSINAQSFASSAYAGGIVGYVYSTNSSPSIITNCYNDYYSLRKVGAAGSSDNASYGGGIAGYVDYYTVINNCYNSGTVTASHRRGTKTYHC